MSVDAPVRIAVTGTPGTGKTTLCVSSGWDYQTVTELATSNGCIEDTDPNDGAAPVDVDRLHNLLLESWEKSEGHTLIDGHLSHHLPVDAILILRCHPDTLRSRLQARDYSMEKTDENTESEFIGVIASECFANSGIPCIEMDGSTLDPEEIFNRLEAWIADGFKPPRPNEPTDWIATIHGGD